MAEDRLLYTTTVHNDQGMKGTAWVEGEDGLRVATSSPLKTSDPGTNPEQLIALSWATCLNATIEIALDRHQLEGIKSEVVVKVDYKKEAETTLTYFSFLVDVYIDLAADQAQAIVAEAEARCPVSRIIGDYEHVTLNIHSH